MSQLADDWMASSPLRAVHDMGRPGPVDARRGCGGAQRVAGLATPEFDVAVFGHGRAVTGRAVDRFRELAAR